MKVGTDTPHANSDNTPLALLLKFTARGSTITGRFINESRQIHNETICGGQRRSQVSLTGGGGLTEFQWGDKPQYL